MNISIKRLGNLIATIIFGSIAYLTCQGILQETIHFSGTANEVGFFILSSGLTFLFAYLTISK